MNVGLYFNRKYLNENSRNIEKITAAFSSDGDKCKVVESADELAGVEILFVLGGDGTILSIAAACAAHGVKIIGINYGHVGFLAEFEPSKLTEAIALVKAGAFKTQKRTMLEISFGGNTFVALNEVVLSRFCTRNSANATVSIRAAIDGETVDEYAADGLLVATPTGSTAYALSAGGSILTPDIAAFILTPVCAHSLHARPVVFSDKSSVVIASESALSVSADGRLLGEINAGEQVGIKKSELSVEFITQDGFFNKLLKKLTKWSR